MVYIQFPKNLTEEEEILRQKYAKLRKKRKILQQLRMVKPERETPAAAPQKRPAPESAKNAKEQAKKLLKSGAIKIEVDNQEKHIFKRSKNLEKKLKDTEKTAVGFQPFSASHPEDEERERSKPRMRGLYESFVSGGNSFDREREREREERRDEKRPDRRDKDREAPRRGNTIYVYGHGINEDILRKAFSNFGTIIHITMEKEKHVGFVTFERMESADQAISEVNGGMIDDVQLRVSMARRQPTFDQVSDPSSASWASIAASSSQKGSHKDKREIVTYDSGDIF